MSNMNGSFERFLNGFSRMRPRNTKFWTAFALGSLVFVSVSGVKIDEDSDGMSDVWEQYFSAEALSPSAQSDGDGYDNEEESIAGTDPLNTSSAPDIYVDSYTMGGVDEWDITLYWYGVKGVRYQAQVEQSSSWYNHGSLKTGNNATIYVADTHYGDAPSDFRLVVTEASNSDSDGLNNMEEAFLGTNPSLADTDSDGVDDDDEFIAGSDPLEPDSDGDGIEDDDETNIYGTDPYDPDTDDDLISDYDELFGSTTTDPLDPDTDYDGRSDYEEIGDQTDPNDHTDFLPLRLGHWKFDNSSFLTEEGSTPAVSAGTLNNPTTWNGAGLQNVSASYGELAFEHVEVGGRANVNLRRGTISMWFKPDWSSTTAGGSGPGSYPRFFEAGYWDPGANSGHFAMNTNPDGTYLSFGSQDGAGGNAGISTTISFVAGEWHHVAVTFDGLTRKLFIDGELKTSSSGSTSAEHYPNLTLRTDLKFNIGANHTGGDRVDGTIDEFTTYNYPMTETEIADHYDWHRSISQDGDSLPDVWEDEMFGDLDQTDSTDFDSDGIPDLGEFNLETDPTSADSVTSVTSPSTNTTNFESNFGIFQNVGTYNWLRDSGGTPSGGTGPSSGHSSSYYAYMETSSGTAYVAGNTAILESSLIKTSGGRAQLSFYYHMYGADMGTLHVDVFDGMRWQESVWSITGQQHTSNGQAYSYAEVPLGEFSGAFMFRFRGVAAGGYRGDMAIDNVVVGFEAADTDSDGITDSWEIANFLSTSNDATTDSEPDGIPDWLDGNMSSYHGSFNEAPTTVDNLGGVPRGTGAGQTKLSVLHP